jgi:hypothetical protein
MMVYADSLDVADMLTAGLGQDLWAEGVRLALSSEPGYLLRLPVGGELVSLWVIPDGEPRPPAAVIV